MRGSYVVETRAICRFTISIYLPSNVKNMGFADVRFGFFFTKKGMLFKYLNIMLRIFFSHNIHKGKCVNFTLDA